VAAHRGDWRNAPENSLQVYKLAMSAGVDTIEVDLKVSKDSVLVILHDQTLNRSTTGKGKLSDYTLAEKVGASKRMDKYGQRCLAAFLTRQLLWQLQPLH